MNFSRREVSLMISALERRESTALQELRKIFGPQSLKKTVCFTGPGGVGKSSLLSGLIPLVSQKESAAWVACDPWSQRTGGSVLGDRIRLDSVELSENCFVRSLSTRSATAISKAVRDIAIYLESLFDHVWIETAGSGQTQLEVIDVAAINVLVLQPETGDAVQWMKSGLQEEADLFVVHKADLEGAERMKGLLVEQGALEKNVLLISSKKRTGYDLFLDRLKEQKNTIDWKKRFQHLSEKHAHALFIESRLQDIESEWAAVREIWKKNPYEKL